MSGGKVEVGVHVELEAALEVDVGLEQGGQAAPAGVNEALPPGELHRDQLPAPRKGLEQRPEIEVDGHQATVEQDEWPAGTVRLAVELQAVHRCACHTGYDGRRPANSSRTTAIAAHGHVVVIADATVSGVRNDAAG
jgi:hypothetical protein